MSETLKKGRPRSQKLDTAVMKATLVEIEKSGFRQTSTDAIAKRAKVSKMAIYRRWPNKAAIVMDALLTIVGPDTAFPSHANALVRLKMQLRRQVIFFAGTHGELVRNLIAESQFDIDLATAFRDRWLSPRREMTKGVLREAIAQKHLKSGVDLDALTDMIYGPFYYRLLLKSGPLTTAFADRIFKQVIEGITTAKHF